MFVTQAVLLNVEELTTPAELRTALQCLMELIHMKDMCQVSIDLLHVATVLMVTCAVARTRVAGVAHPEDLQRCNRPAILGTALPPAVPRRCSNTSCVHYCCEEWSERL